MAPFGLKLWENAFQAIPDISFFDVENFFKTSNGRLPPEDGSDRPQTLGKRVSGDPQHLIFRRPHKFVRQNVLHEKKSKLRTAVYPPRMAPIGLKLRENAFQVIPDISFFDGTNIFCDQNFCCK